MIRHDQTTYPIQNYDHLPEHASSTTLQASDITSLLQPPLYLKMTKAGYQHSHDEQINAKYSIHAMLVEHQNQLMMNQQDQQSSDVSYDHHNSNDGLDYCDQEQ